MPATHSPRHGKNASPWFEDLVILLTLVAFAVAQTVYDILTSNPDLLAARRVSNIQLLAIVGVYGLLPALALWALWELTRRLGALPHRIVFSVLILAFTLALFWQVRNTYLGEGDGLLRSPVLGAAAAAAVAALAWRKERAFRSFLLALSPAILIFPALFLNRTWRAPIAPPPLEASVEASSEPALAPTPNGTPVFVLVFDELALHVLLDAEGRIDAERYPAFAALSGESHWFRNATANSSKTLTAIASIVTGNLPRVGDANHATYPNTIFSLLAPDYDVYIEEVGYTHFCDSEAFYCLNDATGEGTAGLLRDVGYLLADRVLPPKLDVGLPDTSHTWGPFQSAEDWTQAALARCRRVLSAVDALPRDHLLFFAHLILPHSPYALTPEGDIYSVGPYALDEGQDTATLASLLERYRMQVRYVDGWLGQFIQRLKQRGRYDPALLIVTGDHGVSWKPEAPGRTLRPENAELMLPVPLFVKAPFQKEAAYSENDVQHIDLAPTIAEILQTPLPFPVAGRSAFAEAAGRRPKIAFGDDLTRFEFDGRLGLRAVEDHTPDAPFVGESIEGFTVITEGITEGTTEGSVRGKLEAIQIAPPGTPEFAASMPIQVSGWALRTDPDTPTLEIESRAFRSGGHSLAFQGVTGGAAQGVEGLTAGSRYQASAWVRSAAGEAGRASLVVSRPGVEVLAADETAPSGEFRQVQLTFMAPGDGKVLLGLEYRGGPGRVLWDDVSLREAATAPGGAPQAGPLDAGRLEDGPLEDGAGPERITNGGFEEALAEPWFVFSTEPAAASGLPPEVVVTVNGEIVAATRPGAERWDVALGLLTPNHSYLRCGWSVAISADGLREGENLVEAYAVIDPAKRIAVRLDSGWPRVLVKSGDTLERKLR